MNTDDKLAALGWKAFDVNNFLVQVVDDNKQIIANPGANWDRATFTQPELIQYLDNRFYPYADWEHCAANGLTTLPIDQWRDEQWRKRLERRRAKCQPDTNSID